MQIGHNSVMQTVRVRRVRRSSQSPSYVRLCIQQNYFLDMLGLFSKNTALKKPV